MFGARNLRFGARSFPSALPEVVHVVEGEVRGRLGNFTSQLFESFFRVFRADFAENRGELRGIWACMLEINT